MYAIENAEGYDGQVLDLAAPGVAYPGLLFSFADAGRTIEEQAVIANAEDVLPCMKR